MNFDAKDILLLALAAFTAWYLYRLTMAFRANRADPIPGASVSAERRHRRHRIRHELLRHAGDRIVRDDDRDLSAIGRWCAMNSCPGTLNVGHTIGAIMQAFIFTKLVPVEARTLILMIGAAVVGAFLGAGVVSSWPRRRIQIGMGACLLGAAIMLLQGAQRRAGGRRAARAHRTQAGRSRSP